MESTLAVANEGEEAKGEDMARQLAQEETKQRHKTTA